MTRPHTIVCSVRTEVPSGGIYNAFVDIGCELSVFQLAMALLKMYEVTLSHWSEVHILDISSLPNGRQKYRQREEKPEKSTECPQELQSENLSSDFPFIPCNYRIARHAVTGEIMLTVS